jgi:hypothetical protein
MKKSLTSAELPDFLASIFAGFARKFAKAHWLWRAMMMRSGSWSRGAQPGKMIPAAQLPSTRQDHRRHR